MPSTLSWLDFAESDRQRAMQVIDLFREKSTVDELGFAPIRDAFADHLFPGTSTIQTRARYFLFVPWIMRQVERDKLTAPQIPGKVRKRETALISALLAGDIEQGGIIGREAHETLKRMPSSVYWRGLYLWKIRLFSGSVDQYFRHVVRSRTAGSQVIETEHHEPLSKVSSTWCSDLPKQPLDLYARVTFQLTLQEAEFLRERILASQPTSMLAHVLTISSATFNADYPWDQTLREILTPELRATVEDARRFSLCAWGGALTYSLMVADMKHNDELVEKLQIRLEEWLSQIGRESDALSGWDRGTLWSLVHRKIPGLSPRTEAFAEEWIRVALRAARGERVWRDAAVQKLIERRESQLKGARARLRPENHRARDRWQGDAGGRPMDYRWGPTQVIVNDIIAGLHGLTFSRAVDA